MQENRLKKHCELIAHHDSILRSPILRNAADIPCISHLVLNKGLGPKAVADRKQILSAMLAIELISGRRPYVTEARKSIDKFKLRQGMPIGCKVTLRGAGVWPFLDRLMLRALPRARSTDTKTKPPVGNYGNTKRSIAYGIKDLYSLRSHNIFSALGERSSGGLDMVLVECRGPKSP